MPYADPKAEALRRLLGKKSDRVTPDKAGRICLPEAMAQAATIGNESVAGRLGGSIRDLESRPLPQRECGGRRTVAGGVQTDLSSYEPDETADGEPKLRDQPEPNGAGTAWLGDMVGCRSSGRRATPFIPPLHARRRDPLRHVRVSFRSWSRTTTRRLSNRPSQPGYPWPSPPRARSSSRIVLSRRLTMNRQSGWGRHGKRSQACEAGFGRGRNRDSNHLLSGRHSDHPSRCISRWNRCRSSATT